VPVCGDGFIDAPEQCDDGGTTDGDGCSAACQLELLSESEPNDNAPTASGPFSPTALVGASLVPGSDIDFFAVSLPEVSDLSIVTFDGNGGCADVDTVVTLLGPDGTTVLATQSDGDGGPCAKLDAAVDPGARQLAPGTYYVKIEPQLAGTLTPAYRVRISQTSRCGNGVVEGWEGCDGGASCDASCRRIPTCGDGYVDAPEACDDGNITPGDGCGNTCQLESLSEVEPNDSTAEADASAVQLTGTGTLAGAIGVVDDKDLVHLALAQAGVVTTETFDPSASGCTIATTIRLLDAGGAPVATDDNSGIGSCSALILWLTAGSYYVEVAQQGGTGTIPAYLLDLRVEADAGMEAEPNETQAESTAVTGMEFAVRGSHQLGVDTDFFAVTVPPGKSIRAEIIEGSASETCESLDIDSYLTLYDSAGIAIATDEDGGRGFCSRIDGTGVSPVEPGANHLPGGTYYLAVEASPFAQAPSDTAGQFDYHLVVNTR
jgi:cysteine-rich repeat protein